MSFWLSKPLAEDAALPGAGGEATLGAIADAAYRSAKYVDSTFSSARAQEDAIDRRNKAIFADTGVKLDNPYRVNVRTPYDTPGRMFSGSLDRRIRQYEDRLSALAAQHPQARDTIRAGTSVLAMGEELARESDGTLATAMQSRSGLGKWAAVMAGSAAAIPYDPVQVASLGLGGELSAARTIWGAIGKTAVKEALINGATEAIIQPRVQAWRRQAGLDAGFDQAVGNVLMAAGIGGAFGALAGGAQALARGAPGPALAAVEPARPRLSGPELDTATEAIRPLLPQKARAALDGDGPERRELLSALRDQLSPEARGGLDAADIEAHSAALKPQRSAMPDHHAATRAMEMRLAADEASRGFPVDMDRVNRLAALETMDMPALQAAKGKRPLTVSEFVMANGGMADQGGELAARNYAGRGKGFFGRLVHDDGRPLDAMREAVAEAGYMHDRYGSIEEAMARSTPDDLMDLIDADLRGQPVHSVLDFGDGRTALPPRGSEEAQNAAAASMTAILREAGPGIDDDLLKAAAKLHAGGMDAGDALERAAIQLGDLPEPKRAAFTDDFPGFEPVADGVDDVPAVLREDADIADADLEALADEIPGYDDDGYTIREIIDMARYDDDAALMLEHCRLR